MEGLFLQQHPQQRQENNDSGTSWFRKSSSAGRCASVTCFHWEYSVRYVRIIIENILLIHYLNRPLSTCGSLLRESFRVLPCGERFFLWLFEKTRLPLRPCFGGFPVKLRTHIGKYIDSSFFLQRLFNCNMKKTLALFVGEPIYPEPGMTPEQLRDR